MEKLTVAAIEKALRENESWTDFYQDIMHKLDQVTKRDEAIHKRNLHRAQRIRDARAATRKSKASYKTLPKKYKGSYIEDEYAEFREE